MGVALAEDQNQSPQIAIEATEEALSIKKKEALFSSINKASKFLDVFALSWVTPLLMIAAGDSPKRNLKLLWERLAIPLAAVLIFLVAWAQLAPQVKTSLGAIPGPAQVWEQAISCLWSSFRIMA